MANRQAQNYVYAENPDPKYCKKCKYCKQLIDKKAKICPFCRRTQPNGCLTVIGIIILITLLCTFCHALTTYTPSENTSVDTEITTESITTNQIVDASDENSSEKMSASDYAKLHLGTYPYSYLGLIFQLEEGGGYSHEESVSAADSCGADWNENAVKAAQGFAEFSATNVEELKVLLKDEKFTDEQIEYALQALGY